MAQIYSPKIVQDGLVMCLDASHNKSYPTTDLPVKNGLGLWLDASDDTTFSYSSGTNVSQWRDKSGNNFHATQALSANQPSRSTTQNSRKTVNFDGTNDTVTIPNFVCNSEMSIFVVSNCGNTLFIEHSSDVGPSGNGFYIAGIGTAMFLVARNYASSYSFLTNWLSGGYSIASGVNSTGLDLLTYKNGSQQSPTTDSRISISNSYVTSTLYIGSRGANSLWSSGPIAEIIIYNRKVSDTERNLIHTYLGQKWGILNTDRSIIDLSGLDDNGLLGNGTTAAMPAFDYYNKGALRFDGTDDYLVTSVPSIAASSTVAVWIKSSNYGGKIPLSIAGATYASGPNIFFYGNYINWNTGDGDGNPFSGSSYPDSNWHYIVVTNDAATNAKLYIDGILIGTATYKTTLSTNANNFWLGRFSGDNNYTINANIAAAQLYNKVLSAAEVSQNYEAQKGKFTNTIVQQGLVLNLDAGNPYSYAGAGTTWIDVSGAVNDFTIVNSPTYSADQFTLNGTTQYFSISAASGFFINNTNNFYADVGYAWSVSVWFKFPVSPTSVRDATINAGNCSYCMFGNSGGIGGAETLSLFVSGISGTFAGFHPYFCIVGVRGSKTQLSDSSVNTNTWNNVVVTWNGSAGRGYFNGVDKGALNIGANGMQVSGYTIGTTGGGASGHLFEGSISQTFVYSRAISAAEVLQNYNAIKGRFGL